MPGAEETSLHFEAEHFLIPFRICFDIRDAKTDVIEFPLLIMIYLIMMIPPDIFFFIITLISFQKMILYSRKPEDGE